MKKTDVVILGGGGHAKVAIGTLQRCDNIHIVGFLDDDSSKENILGVKRVGNLFPIDEKLTKYSIILGLGHIGNTKFREKVVEEYEKKGFIFESVIAPSAVINNGVTLGKGIVIFDGAIVQPGVTIEDYAIINTNASVDHDCHIGRHDHLAPGTALSGNVIVGDRVLIGTGAAVIQDIKIEDDCVIGAGAVVVKNCDSKGGVYMGSPAKLIKTK